ncbi:MAG TPA: EAL domain-containing protein, partial [Pyrinomonadaceae bacterium]|nr:EAL domain-containing protein [Pyrinomonadaceae bacterium]
LREACRQTRQWQHRISTAKPISISVNLSAKQLMHPSLTSRVREILASTGLDARNLKLEVTESTVMEHSETALRVLNELKALGVRLSTDDFGTGYSSLSYLHQFPFDRMKIDRSFIGKMDADLKSEAIVRTILILGQNLEIEVVAEGIENEQQLWQLRSLGCRYGQGYFFSKPVCAEEAEKLLREGLPVDISLMEAPFVFSKMDNHRFIEIDEVY